MISRFFWPLALFLVLLTFSDKLFAGSTSFDDSTTFADSTPTDEELLSMYFGKEATVITPTRYLKPISEVAENMTVITSDMIEEMNAHTLAEVLNNVTGVQMDTRLVFGNYSDVSLQGVGYQYVRVLIDGVTLNDLGNNFARIGDIPVQNIDKIEIIKGPASSSWGSSLGGVINIITKSGNSSVKAGGMLSASYGERDSGDFRAEAGGKVSSLDYYIYSGHLHSSGFTPNTLYDGDSFYTKENLDITDKVNVVYTLGYDNISRGAGNYPRVNLSDNNKFHNFFSTLTLTDSISDQATLSLGARYINQYQNDRYLKMGSGVLSSEYTGIDNTKGATVNLVWKPEGHTLVFGSEYDDGSTKATGMNGVKNLIKSAVFTNDTLSVVKNVYITPGLRFDNINTSGSFLSPSFGITYKPAANTTIRFFVTRGFNAPSLTDTYGTGISYVPNLNLKVEKVWSYQTGIETTMLQYVWLKLNLFRHDVSDAITYVPVDTNYHYTYVNEAKQRRQGLEAEIETVPLYNVSMNSGYSFVDATDLLTQTRLADIGRHTLDIGARYRKDGLMALLQGHYIVWDNIDYKTYNDKAFIFNLNVIKQLYQNKNVKAETFLTAHNIFNGSQNLTSTKNPGRWFEGGVRFNF
ncbi:MAG: TonB-dependent receptor [Nitrospirae bacterium]|nr:TonB-dependent receptor [Nitrospirota bacterium]